MNVQDDEKGNRTSDNLNLDITSEMNPSSNELKTYLSEQAANNIPESPDLLKMELQGD